MRQQRPRKRSSLFFRERGARGSLPKLREKKTAQSSAFTAATAQHALSPQIEKNVPFIPCTLRSKGPPQAIALACRSRAPTKKAATQESAARGRRPEASTRPSWMRTSGAYLVILIFLNVFFVNIERGRREKRGESERVGRLREAGCFPFVRPRRWRSKRKKKKKNDCVVFWHVHRSFLPFLRRARDSSKST